MNSETAMKMSVLNFKNIAVLAIAVATLNACGDAKKMMGLEKTAPDEFAVYSRAPLSLPPDYSLKPPTPGAERPQAEDESIKAQRALTGRDVRPATGGENGYANMTPGLEMLLQQTGAAGADPSIRQKIDRETSAFIQESQSFTDDIMFWKNKEAFGTKVDATKEAQRIREAQALGETVDGQGAVVIERKDQAILEGLFN